MKALLPVFPGMVSREAGDIWQLHAVLLPYYLLSIQKGAGSLQSRSELRGISQVQRPQRKCGRNFAVTICDVALMSNAIPVPFSPTGDRR